MVEYLKRERVLVASDHRRIRKHFKGDIERKEIYKTLFKCTVSLIFKNLNFY